MFFVLIVANLGKTLKFCNLKQLRISLNWNLKDTSAALSMTGVTIMLDFL